MTNVEKYKEIVAEMINLQNQIEELRQEAESLWESMTQEERESFQYQQPMPRKGDSKCVAKPTCYVE